MRQRITFVHEPHDAIDPKSFELSKDGERGPSLNLKGLRAAREDRIVFANNDLSKDVRELFERTDEIHIKHVRPGSSQRLPPFSARIGSGLHASFEDKGEAGSDLSEWLVEEFRVGGYDACGDMNSYSFKSNGTGSRSKSKVEQTAYYIPRSQLPSQENWMAPHRRHRWGNLLSQHSTLTKDWSKDRLDELDEATSIDIDYDVNFGLRRFLTLTAYWSPRVWASTTIEKLGPSSTIERIEVGVLSNETPERPEEVKLAGYLMVLGESTEPKATMFSFPSKHHSHDASYAASWIEPTGLHPNLGLRVDNSLPPKAGEECRLYAHLTLPPTIFADRYQFSDALFLASKNLSSLAWTSSPVDLEAPEYAEAAQVSSVLLELAPPTTPKNETWTAEIPLHLRYLKPNRSGYREADVPTPMLFWGCESEEMDGMNPFERQGMVIEKLLPGKNVFYHLSDEGEGYQTISVPVLSTQYERYIELGTSLVILLGFGWVMWKSLQVLLRVGYGNGEEKLKVEMKKNE